MTRSSPSRPLAAFAFAVLLAACTRAAPPAENANTVPVVSVIEVAPARALGALTISGLIAFKRETPLAFDAAGAINAINVDVGDSVRVGQSLASMRRATVGANAAEAALARDTAQRQLARIQALHDQGFASQAALDVARLNFERARDASSLSSPSAGIVLRRSAEPGQTVAAGQAILIIGEPAFGMVVRASASSADAAHIAMGQHATITIAGALPKTGTVSRASPKSDGATGAFEIEIRIDDVAGLRSGQVAAVTVETQGGANGQQQLLIPTLALLDARADQGVVYVVDAQMKAHRRAIETDGLAGDNVVVVSGLAPGERIVGEGAAYVRDNEPVRAATAPRE